MKLETEIMEVHRTPSSIKEIPVSLLTRILMEKGITNSPVRVVGREQNIYSSTFPSEIVSCRLAEGKELRLFCKYGSKNHHSHDHKGNVAYEASVYRQVLEPLRISTPKFFGSAAGETRDSTWLIVEFLHGADRLELAQEPDIVIEAARWIGRFHALNESRTIAIPGFKNYREEYFSGWIQRTLQLAGDFKQKFPWLAGLSKSARKIFSDSLAGSMTVIHGEYYPNNILVRNRKVHPVDWESAAISFGEIDLATLTDDWGDSKEWTPEIFRQCVLEYQLSRWPEGSPADFERTFLLARLYVQFRWLGDSRERASKGNRIDWRFQELRRVGEQLGIL